MPKKYSHKADIDENGKLVKIWGKGMFDEELKQFAGKTVVITVEKYVKKRSLKQNSLLHAYLNEIADQTKMHLSSVKDAMKAQFLTVDILDDEGAPIVNPLTGEVLKRVRDTSELNTEEMSIFCEEIKLFVMDFGVYLKNPGENEELKFNL